MFVWCGPRIGDLAVTFNLRPKFSGWAVLFVSLAALTLAGCGRKGPLDLPPNASSASTANLQQPMDTEAQQAAKPSVFNPSYGANAAPVAGKGPKRPFALDPLLGN
jgi:predicted small lipoprotein YifL